MANIYLSLLVIGLSATHILSLLPVSVAPPGVHYIEELDEHRDAYMKMVTMRNGKRVKISAAEQLCHNAHTECVRVVESAELVCTHHGRYGLVNFPSLCEVRFQNCLIQSREAKAGKESKYGEFYYNGQLRGCQYYVEKTKTVPEAINMFFSEDKNRNLRSYEYNEKGKKKHYKQLQY